MDALFNSSRYEWLVDYLLSDRIDLDDAIVACVSKEAIDKLIDTELEK